ncbi:oligopeptide/dipeptide ABC transporter ATP-binding protein [Polymorphospora sp. A560]|uniref:oligopeptide/dipeptide ABC transporter ATP-binding protein n=1 Tax=Polymorphospora sp. A560 TaxID=3040203 RepID=UPI0038926079
MVAVDGAIPAGPPVIAARNLHKTFVTSRNLVGRAVRTVPAVQDVSLAVHAGRTLGIVGESGSGKSTVARLLLRLIQADHGSVSAGGIDVSRLRRRELRAWRRNAQMVHQDPFTSMDPRMRVRDSVAEPLHVHEPGLGRDEVRARVDDLLRSVGVDPGQGERYPSGFSGGQLQRIAIARALAPGPSVLVCDEAVAALDVSIRGQILNLLRDLQRERGIALVFISHDLSLVRAIAHEIVVMYRGRVVETGDAEQVFAHAAHPYTRRLLHAIPVADPVRQRERQATTTEPATGPAPVAGCQYAPRCPLRIDRCGAEPPPLVERPDGGAVACFVASGTRDGTGGGPARAGAGPVRVEKGPAPC